MITNETLERLKAAHKLATLRFTEQDAGRMLGIDKVSKENLIEISNFKLHHPNLADVLSNAA